MASKKDEKSSRIPIRFDDEASGERAMPVSEMMRASVNHGEDSSPEDDDAFEIDLNGTPGLDDILADEVDGDTFRASPTLARDEASAGHISEPNLKHDAPHPDAITTGPITAELVGTRAELRRVEAELSRVEIELEQATAAQEDLTGRMARLQADFDNYRKRVERERGETHNAIIGEIVTKLLPVVDNFRRAVGAEQSATNDSEDFRNFAGGVRLIEKQLNEVLQSYGVEPVETIGHPFDPHIHEAIATEESDRFEPETVIEEIVRGYRLRDRLLRPAMVKVAK